jgi:hypothetical protein
MSQPVIALALIASSIVTPSSSKEAQVKEEECPAIDLIVAPSPPLSVSQVTPLFGPSVLLLQPIRASNH